MVGVHSAQYFGALLHWLLPVLPTIRSNDDPREGKAVERVARQKHVVDAHIACDSPTTATVEREGSVVFALRNTLNGEGYLQSRLT